MRLTDGQRVDLFSTARSLHPQLGALFQNEMDIKPEDFEQEIAQARYAKQQEMDRYQAYIDKLGMMMCFPNQEIKS